MIIVIINLFQLCSRTEENIVRATKIFYETDRLRQKIAGKSIPDEKFASKKAASFLSGQSTLVFGFLEAAYYFNYLKMGNFNEEVARFWLNFIRDRERLIEKDHEDRAIFHVIKANLLSQV